MVGRELLDELQSAGFTVTFRPPNRLEVTPASALTDELRETIRANKPLLVKALRSRKKVTPVRQCRVCNGTAFWARPPEAGGGFVCCRCDPDPRNLVAVWERRSAEAATPMELEPKRAWLLTWALAAGCPELRFHPWASVSGTSHGWQRFVLTASDADIEAAALAAGRTTASDQDSSPGQGASGER